MMTTLTQHTSDALGGEVITSTQRLRHLIEQHSATHWFDPSTMRFFNSRVGALVYGGVYFVSSERYDDNSPRLYSIRAFNFYQQQRDTDGRVVIACNVWTVGEFQGFSSARAAVTRIRQLLKAEACTVCSAPTNTPHDTYCPNANKEGN